MLDRNADFKRLVACILLAILAVGGCVGEYHWKKMIVRDAIREAAEDQAAP